MAKAIYGHVGPDARWAAEVARLKARVQDLEAEVERLRAAADLADMERLLAHDLLVPDPR
ncbi:MAG: hypothetical protein ACO3ID_06400 [Candidatus Nanopelagicales bacterium]|jgi:uncharacterized small protein (DUF1192 family)